MRKDEGKKKEKKDKKLEESRRLAIKTLPGHLPCNPLNSHVNYSPQ